MDWTAIIQTAILVFGGLGGLWAVMRHNSRTNDKTLAAVKEHTKETLAAVKEHRTETREDLRKIDDKLSKIDDRLCEFAIGIPALRQAAA